VVAWAPVPKGRFWSRPRWHAWHGWHGSGEGPEHGGGSAAALDLVDFLIAGEFGEGGEGVGVGAAGDDVDPEALCRGGGGEPGLDGRPVEDGEEGAGLEVQLGGEFADGGGAAGAGDGESDTKLVGREGGRLVGLLKGLVGLVGGSWGGSWAPPGVGGAVAGVSRRAVTAVR
jgi:hypothetical protein